MMGKSGKKTSRAEQKARRPQEILEAAFEEFTAKGYEATRVEDIAARLRVTKGTIYLYFPTKDALFDAMMRQMSTPFEDVLASVGTLEGTHAERLRALLVLTHEKIADDRKARELLRLTLAEGGRFPHIVDRDFDENIAPLLAAVQSLVEQGVASGEFRVSPAMRTPEVIVSSILLVAVMHLMFEDRRPIEGQEFIEAHLDLVLNGLLLRP